MIELLVLTCKSAFMSMEIGRRPCSQELDQASLGPKARKCELGEGGTNRRFIISLRPPPSISQPSRTTDAKLRSRFAFVHLSMAKDLGYYFVLSMSRSPGHGVHVHTWLSRTDNHAKAQHDGPIGPMIKTSLHTRIRRKRSTF
jgi:hypothetical protein